MTDQDLLHSQAAVDDCWNRIGVFGDKSCPQLERHIHCRNCEVYGAAAIALLDRYGSTLERDDDDYGQGETEEAQGAQRSLLIFRLGEQWLAIATRCLAEVMPVSPIHVLPHRNSRGLLGVTNVRGTLVACLSLAELLGLETQQDARRGERRVIPRMLILESDSGPLVTPVDEVSGIQRIPLARISNAKHDDKRAISRFTAGVLQWQEQSITLLDDEQLLQTMIGSLA
ncbi:chemotaxis protein CheW [Ectopseudomonas alcaliphila]|uniref:chemotaxis protein CheW n=1 Tax=Ectopseudomonas alcaliphila TaxID=101564 RepID=UPI002786A72F|nr:MULTISPECIES: chemotaxis protein CheW [Pseudomonas]MDP9941951.1 chemotaxis-related protein WspD [Pseudomonas sp. 3400]MDR7014763.1 chemotaxis-related protein WspD [Pseudomonas alcaliphila]